LTSTKWTEKAEAELRDMWNAGLSAWEISKRFKFGYTRNAVIGKARRMGLAQRKEPANFTRAETKLLRVIPGGKTFKKDSPKKSKAEKRADSDALREYDGAFVPLEGSTPKTLLELGTRECRWPLGEALDGTEYFCGCATASASYCETHHAIAFRPAKEIII
jgi:GcrA cell cycle regulator